MSIKKYIIQNSCAYSWSTPLQSVTWFTPEVHNVIPNNPKAKYRFLATGMWWQTTKHYLNLLKIYYYHTAFQDPIFGGDSIASTS
jgi:hypothetical protein